MRVRAPRGISNALTVHMKICKSENAHIFIRPFCQELLKISTLLGPSVCVPGR